MENANEDERTINLIVNVRVVTNSVGIQNCAIQSNYSTIKYVDNFFLLPGESETWELVRRSKCEGDQPCEGGGEEGGGGGGRPRSTQGALF